MTQPGQAGRIFVGRQPEMAGLKAAMDDAVAGHGRLVMLAGEPGIGKTRTAQELSRYAESAGAQVWWGSCHEQQGAPPYWPWVQPIRSYIQRTGPESLAAQMGPGAADISEIIPLVREKLPDLEPASPLEPEQARFRLFDSISQFLVNAARAQPLLLVLDDLHWADQPSLLLLEFLVGQLSDSNIMIVGTYRDIEVSREDPLSNTLARLARSESYAREELRGLEGESVAQLINDISGQEPSQELVDAIHARTEGNPFFMTELIRLLEERQSTDGAPVDTVLSGLEIPQSVLEVIGQRLNRLSTECEAALTTAAVIGRQFDFGVLSSLIEDSNETQLLKVIDEGLDAHLIQEVPGQGDVYQFSHAIIQQTLRERLSSSRRVRLHARIGEALETLYGDETGDHAAELAYHFAEAEPVGGPDKLVKYTMLAGEKALDTYAYEEALGHFQRGLLAKGVDAEGATPLPDADAAALLFGLARAQAATLRRHNLDVAFASLSRAFDFYAETNEVTLAITVAEFPMQTIPGHQLAAKLVGRALRLIPPDSPEAGRLLANYVLVMGLEEGDYQAAVDAFESALGIAQRTGNIALEARALANYSIVDYWHMRWQGAIDKGLRVAEMPRLAADQFVGSECQSLVASAFWHLGDSKAAQPQAEALLASAEGLRDRYRLATALWFKVLLSTCQGEWQAAKDFN
ncbi:MAG: AAA family ATPase, partial [Chloroflexi bacterium]|nr:AAA family ATPase [Chloroflexota bacterium]